MRARAGRCSGMHLQLFPSKFYVLLAYDAGHTHAQFIDEELPTFLKDMSERWWQSNSHSIGVGALLAVRMLTYPISVIL